MSTDSALQWFAIKRRTTSLASLMEQLDTLAMEYFRPIRVRMTERKGKRIMVNRAVIPNMVFVYTTKTTLYNLINSLQLNAKIVFDCMTKDYLVIPDKQMGDFRFLLQLSEDTIEITNQPYRRGDRVRVTQGQFAGIEGELIRVQRHKRVVIRLEGLVSLATTYIPPAYLEKIEN